jgi:dTDP-4-dehydrorhamnose reductase
MTSTKSEKVLVLGATGMLGNAVLRYFVQHNRYEVIGSARTASKVLLLPESVRDRILCDLDVEVAECLEQLFSTVQPTIVVNCVGLIKQLRQSTDPLEAIPINSLLPHRLARLCQSGNARLIHISTDCVFSGSKGLYREDDLPDATDLYGRSKCLGEVIDQPHAVTLRTSIIGHEIGSTQSLVDWFLAQEGQVRGFVKAVFSGMPAVELARVIHDFVIPNPKIRGLFHVSATSISKHELLGQIAHVYGKTIDIEPDATLVLDRSLDSARFRAAVGYEPPAWAALIESMRRFG